MNFGEDSNMPTLFLVEFILKWAIKYFIKRSMNFGEDSKMPTLLFFN